VDPDGLEEEKAIYGPKTPPGYPYEEPPRQETPEEWIAAASIAVVQSIPHKPNEEECASILKKIENIEKDIKKRISELREDILTLPEAVAGDNLKPSLSRRGHRRLINQLKANLAFLKATYAWKCRKQQLAPQPSPCPTPAPAGSNPPVIDPKKVEAAVVSISVGVVVYWVISEGSRVIPVRNLIPVP
jgi:hypothetical protein